LRHHGDHNRADTLFVSIFAIQQAQEDRDITLMGGCQPTHPLFEIGLVITPIAVGDSDGYRFLF
jgi:hypothetical protein